MFESSICGDFGSVHSRRWLPLLFVVGLVAGPTLGEVASAETANRSKAAQGYLDLLENFSGFAEQHWNEKEQAYDASGAGVTWPRGNGAVCLMNAVLLTEYPNREHFSAKKIPRNQLLDHTRQAIRSVALTNNTCTDPRAKKPGTWGGQDPDKGGWHWQAGLETEHWVLAAHLLKDQLDEDTLALVRQVAGAEADGAAERPINSGKLGNTTADDASWNAGILGVSAAIYKDDPRAKKWDEWAKRWALNMEGREPDRTSDRMIDGKPLKEWIVAINTYPDLTLENHGFWDLPYQTSFADLSEAIVAYKMCGLEIPEAFHANMLEEGEYILKWLAMPDGDFLCPQGIDWAERDVQHSWAYTLLGTLLDQEWALAAEARCLDLLTRRQAAFGDGSIHALDFGYQTDLARIWLSSFLLHKYFGDGAESGPEFDPPKGANIYPYVAVGVFRAPNLASSVTWFRSRQPIMVSPTNLKAVGDRTAFTRWDHQSGTGWATFKGDKKPRGFKVKGEPSIDKGNDALHVSFVREIPGAVSQEIGYCALAGDAVAVFSRWRALDDVEVEELIDHPYRWVEIEKFLSKPSIDQPKPGVWNIENKLQLEVLGSDAGEQATGGINGAVRRNISAKKGEVLLDTVAVYQAIVPGKAPAEVKRVSNGVQIGDQVIRRGDDGKLSLEGGARGG